VDEIGEQSDAAAGDEDRKLGAGGEGEDSQREPDRPQSLPRAFDALVYQAMRVTVAPVMMVIVVVVVGARRRLMGMRAVMVMRVGQAAVVTMTIAVNQFVARGPSGHHLERLEKKAGGARG
jgi:hypothetical protein